MLTDLHLDYNITTCLKVQAMYVVEDKGVKIMKDKDDPKHTFV